MIFKNPQLTMNKAFELIINGKTVKYFIILKKNSDCSYCHDHKEICLKTWQSNIWEWKHYCWKCAINHLHQLETGDYYIKNKPEIINKIRENIKPYEQY